MALSKEEIARRKAEATGQPTPVEAGPGGGVAVRDPMPTGVGLLNQHPEFQAYIGPDLERDALVAALAQPSWAQAIKKGGLEAIAGALYLCKENRLLPHRNHVYVMQIDGKWQPMISAFGYAAIATRLVNNSGTALFRGVEYDDPSEVERGGEIYVTVKCRVKRSDGGSFEGIGRKPRLMTIGEWEGPSGNRRKVGDKKVFDKDAEGKAESMAMRRACQFAFPGNMPLDPPPGFSDPDDVIDGEVVPPDALAAGPAAAPPTSELKPEPVQRAAPPAQTPGATAPYAGARSYEDAAAPEDEGEGGGTDGSSREGAGAEPAASTSEPVQPGEPMLLEPPVGAAPDEVEAVERANAVQRLHDAMDAALAGPEARDAFLNDMIERAEIVLAGGESAGVEGVQRATTAQLGAWAAQLEKALAKRQERSR